MTSPVDRRTSFDRDLAATAGLMAFSMTVAIGFARVFSGWSFLVDLGLLVVLGHGVSFLLRRARVSGWLSAPFVIVLLSWVLLALQYGDTFSWLFPTDATWDLLGLEVGLVRDQFQTAIAPVLYGTGWATLAGVAMIITTVMGDAFAFRAEARGEALVPGGVLFVFIAALGSDRMRSSSTALLIGAGVVAVVALRSLHDRTRRVELTSRRTVSMMLPAAIGTAAAIALLAGVVGPRIPGAQADPLYETRGRGGVTNVLSPLVDIRSRLTNRSNVELFRVNADAPAYWRVTTLPEFNGQQFRLPERRLERVEGSLSAGEGRRVRQQIQILSLGGKLVPAAADPFQADGYSGGTQIRLDFNPDTSTLVTSDDIQAGDLFTVVSAAPILDADRLRSATSANAPDDTFTDLPDNLPAVVTDLAAAVTAGSDNTYDQAIALQSWFHDEFEYSLDVQSGHGSNAIESFLNERIGYCEQFAATYAAMARTLGIPSRVAVGFTPGVINDDGWYSVLGKNAHAWPELWFDGIGWVAFEPTPGRGAPGAEAYTGLQPEQDASGPDPAGGGGGPGGENGDVVPTTPSTVVAPPSTLADGSTATTLPDGSGLIPNGPEPDFGGELANGDTAPTVPGEGGGVPWTPILVIFGILALLAVPAIVRWWRSRALQGHDATKRVHDAWAHARRAAERAGVGGRPSMTAHEWAAATATQLPVAARPMTSLADVVDRVSFAPPGSVDLEHAGTYGSTLRHDCELWSHQITRIAADTMTTRQRMVQYFRDWD